MARTEPKEQLLPAPIAVARHDELGSVPTEEEMHQVCFLSRVMYQAIVGLHDTRKAPKKHGQLASFSRQEKPYGYAHRLCQGLHQ